MARFDLKFLGLVLFGLRMFDDRRIWDFYFFDG